MKIASRAASGVAARGDGGAGGGWARWTGVTGASRWPRQLYPSRRCVVDQLTMLVNRLRDQRIVSRFCCELLTGCASQRFEF